VLEKLRLKTLERKPIMKKKLPFESFYKDMKALDASGCISECFYNGQDMCPLSKLAFQKGFKITQKLQNELDELDGSDDDPLAEEIMTFLKKKYDNFQSYLERFYEEYDWFRNARKTNKKGVNAAKNIALNRVRDELSENEEDGD